MTAQSATTWVECTAFDLPLECSPQTPGFQHQEISQCQCWSDPPENKQSIRIICQFRSNAVSPVDVRKALKRARVEFLEEINKFTKRMQIFESNYQLKKQMQW